MKNEYKGRVTIIEYYHIKRQEILSKKSSFYHEKNIYLPVTIGSQISNIKTFHLSLLGDITPAYANVHRIKLIFLNPHTARHFLDSYICI